MSRSSLEKGKLPQPSSELTDAVLGSAIKRNIDFPLINTAIVPSMALVFLSDKDRGGPQNLLSLLTMELNDQQLTDYRNSAERAHKGLGFKVSDEQLQSLWLNLRLQTLTTILALYNSLVPDDQQVSLAYLPRYLNFPDALSQFLASFFTHCKGKVLSKVLKMLETMETVVESSKNSIVDQHRKAVVQEALRKSQGKPADPKQAAVPGAIEMNDLFAKALENEFDVQIQF